ncbi:hypothetical protein [Streptomyces sp. 891-h]|uniref:hypothetical protein n=1 Tax=Streptomyces sp. 891-h TaxID=2720714 RepID=UPI001FAA9D81|nr:hypothetical protein [Streptomyces sp. 891-h]UNZ21416.1 hypothetical protein HC362_34550 [Streptomyces sp. 891-h]
MHSKFESGGHAFEVSPEEWVAGMGHLMDHLYQVQARSGIPLGRFIGCDLFPPYVWAYLAATRAGDRDVHQVAAVAMLRAVLESEELQQNVVALAEQLLIMSARDVEAQARGDEPGGRLGAASLAPVGSGG